MVALAQSSSPTLDETNNEKATSKASPFDSRGVANFTDAVKRLQ